MAIDVHSIDLVETVRLDGLGDFNPRHGNSERWLIDKTAGQIAVGIDSPIA
jgi:hypothetical protein